MSVLITVMASIGLEHGSAGLSLSTSLPEVLVGSTSGLLSLFFGTSGLSSLFFGTSGFSFLFFVVGIKFTLGKRRSCSPEPDVKI